MTANAEQAPAEHAPARDPKARRNERLALTALAGMALVWGYNWVVMKQVLAYVGPFDFSALRTLFGAVALLLVLAALRRPMRIRAWPRVLLLGVLQTGVFSALIQVALLQGGAGKTSILVYTMPFWVIPLAWVAFGERIRGLQWLALALAAAGLLLILEPWSHHAGIVSEMLAVASGLCWALATLVAKWIKRDHPMDALPLTAWQMLFGALALCVVAWLVPERPIAPAPYFYAALAYNALLATALAWFLWLFALQHLSAGMAGLSSLGVPVVGVLSGWLELGEVPGGLELSGMILIGVALAVISLRPMGGRG
ncbi:DMT family transporter [Castellaniella defragrans]|uniref:Drug/metabolite transporter (DMT)-like permease n=1 Tax=Castellaniella defragrans TaxID=75697 RepID=A0A7W9WQA6_CASDE|nr:EamA family transporter [Castellaniella defragrans]MBB6085324.1 drug/metabolite transporter (DMT)-like permease [Castellaniella defragrans]